MNTTQISLKPIGSVLKDAWRIYRKHMNALALVSIIPFIFSSIAMVFHPELALNRGALIGMLVVIGAFNLLNIIFTILMPLALVETTHEMSQGRTVDVNAAYHKAYTLFFPYLFVLLLSGIIIIGGSIFFIVPGIIVSVYLMLTLFVFLFEKKRGIDALVQSAWYIKGFWWDMFARKIILAIVAIAALLVFMGIIGGISVFAGFSLTIVSFLIDLFVFLTVVPFLFCAVYVIYKDLHLIKAGSVPDAHFIAGIEKVFILLLIIPCIILLVVFFILNFGPHYTLHMAGHMRLLPGMHPMTNRYPHGFMGY